jgi:hypothetical protein
MKLLHAFQRLSFCLFVFTLGLMQNSIAETNIPAGTVSGTWTTAHSPYLVDGEITIPDSETLTIEPGVQVIFQGHYKFNVQGQLLAVGTQEDTITFTAADTKTGWHGIRFIDTPDSNDSSKICYCHLQYGKANTGEGLDRSGGAILISRYNKVLVSDCRFDYNFNNGDPYSNGGPAVFIHYASPIITKSTFTNNNGINGAIGCYYESNAIIANNIFSKNKGSWGGAIACGVSRNNRPIFSGNFISNNFAEDGGGVYLVWTSNALVINNIIIRNHASGEGGGINCEASGKPIIVNNTIAFNSSPYGGGIECDDNSDPVIINTIFYGNTASFGKQVILTMTASDPCFLYCTIEGGKEGFSGAGAGDNYSGLYLNNIDRNPLFMDAANNDFHLMDNSPCISGGADSVEVNGTRYGAPAFDLEGNPRPNPAGTVPDIGACESNSGYAAPPNGIEHVKLIPTGSQLLQNFPNPFNPATTISYTLSHKAQVKLSVYDLLGHEVAVLVNETKSIGTHQVQFNAAKLAGGIYFYTIHAQSENGYRFHDRKKLILLK